MKHVKRVILIFLLIVLCTVTATASPRVSAGASCIYVNSSGMLEGDTFGVRRVKSIAPAVTLEGEIVPFEQFSIFLKADCAPFNPKISSKGETLPSFSGVVFKNTLVGSFSFGFGWQLPLSYWTRMDCPLEITLGAVFNTGLFSLSYDTPYQNFKGRELSLGGGAFESISLYIDNYIGFTITSTQTFSFGDYSVWTRKMTNQGESKGEQFVATPVIFSSTVSLGLTYRFDY